MPQTKPDRLLMVYNAEQGMFNALNDWAHKFFSPSTYECPLCRHTYGVTGMLVPWKNFLQTLPYPTHFLYRQYFWQTYPSYRDVALPLILVEKNGEMDVLLLADEIKECDGLPALITRLQEKFDTWTPPNENQPPPASS